MKLSRMQINSATKWWRDRFLIPVKGDSGETLAACPDYYEKIDLLPASTYRQCVDYTADIIKNILAGTKGDVILEVSDQPTAILAEIIDRSEIPIFFPLHTWMRIDEDGITVRCGAQGLTHKIG